MMLISSSASLPANFARAPGVFGSSRRSTSASVYCSRPRANAFLALTTLSTITWVVPVVPDVSVRQPRILTFSLPRILAILASMPGRFSWVSVSCFTLGMVGLLNAGCRVRERQNSPLAGIGSQAQQRHWVDRHASSWRSRLMLAAVGGANAYSRDPQSHFPQAFEDRKEFKDLAKTVSEKIKKQCPGITWKDSYATLGRFGVVDIVKELTRKKWRKRPRKSPDRHRGVSCLASVRATHGGCLSFFFAVEFLSGASRPFHTPAAAGSCVLPATAGPGVWRSGCSFPSAHTVCVPAARTYKSFSRQSVRTLRALLPVRKSGKVSAFASIGTLGSIAGLL